MHAPCHQEYEVHLPLPLQELERVFDLLDQLAFTPRRPSNITLVRASYE
jgi:hypothetical protein